jgi:pilus assembly protein CpaB
MKLRLRLPDRRWGMLGLALAAGALAAWLSQRHIQSRLDQIDAEARAVHTPAVVAATDLEPGTRLSADMVAVRDVPSEWLPSGYVEPTRYADVDGSVLAHRLRRGEPIALSHLEAERVQGLSGRLDAGRRAVTIPVDELSSVSGLVQPGDAVDLHVSFEHRGRRVTMPLLQGMRVLATGHRVDAGQAGEAGREAFSTLTLDAAPADALKLIAAREGGTITAMLRKPGDSSPAAGRLDGDLASMLGLREKPAKAAPPRPSVTIIYGDRPPRRIPGLGESETPGLPIFEEGMQ